MGIETTGSGDHPALDGVASAGNGGWGLKLRQPHSHVLISRVASAGNGGWGLKRPKGFI